MQKVGWIELVPDRSSQTLHPIIQEWCLPGTIIASDGWAAYHGIQQLGFEHRVVIHENHFVDPATGAHTNSVENYWQRCKRRLKRIYGTNRNLLPSHIDEFMWLERYGKSISDCWNNLFRTLKANFNKSFL